ncbi:PREDICTED: acyl-coenzyme A thioesterase THEM5 [Propithecus coquereli]|uniref:acyl-coenzyme A thioesterase THEM5 n=1 Tax=Propithecus coquereli TaxID=379532 RepID=UPI00063F9353|nr:PREDICTED: acyl-coenzyme A thioesterase THEM5 [Propithecus coquereli]
MLRTVFQVAARWGQQGALLRAPCILPGFNPASASGSSTDSLVSRFCPEKTDLKDYALPNASWCPDMLSLYQEFLEKTKSGGWIKLPSFKSNRDHIQGLKLPSGLAVASGMGFAHGGSLAAMMDETFSKTAYLAGEGLLTLSLNIRFKNLIPVGSLAVLNVDVEKIEDQKLYISCVTQSRDQQTVYAKSSGVFLQLQLEKESS